MPSRCSSTALTPLARTCAPVGEKCTYRSALMSICIVILSMAMYTTNSAEIFSDSFESADFSSTNIEGFKWSFPNRTSIVKQDPEVGAVVVNNGKAIYNIIGSARDWTAKSGIHSMRFHYPAGESMSEQRFNLVTPHRDLWFRYWLRVPVNFRHGTGNNNNKLFAIYMDSYEFKGLGPTVVWQYRNNGSNGSNTVVYHLNNTGTMNDSNGQRHSGELQSTPFITYPDDQGRWMQLVFHVKAASNSSLHDGVIQMWRRWQNESSFTKLHEITNAQIHSPVSTNGWRAGYIMGWANAAYSVDTEWLLDDFIVSDTSLVSVLRTPRAPSSVRVQAR